MRKFGIQGVHGIEIVCLRQIQLVRLITKDMVRESFSKMKNRKANGLSDVVSEMVKARENRDLTRSQT